MRSILNSRFVLVIACFASQSAFAQWTLDVQSNWSQADGASINFVLTNNSQSSFASYGSNLPWGTRDKLLLIVLPLAENASPLKPPIFIDDPRVDPIAIKPGETLKGHILVNQRYPDLKRYIQKQSVAVCYKYRFENIEPGSKQIAEGCLLLAMPKNSDSK